MRRVLLIVLALIMALSLVACGNGKTDPPSGGARATVPSGGNDGSGNGDNAASDSQGGTKTSDNPTFTGDVFELCGLDIDEALDKLGKGFYTGTKPGGTPVNYGKEISNEDGSIFIRLQNSADDIKRFTVYQITLKRTDNISINGISISIGDTLKEVDKLLMDDGAFYSGGLSWRVNIDNAFYKYGMVKLTSPDDKTLDTIIVEIPYAEEQLAGQYEVIEGAKLNDGGYTFEEDWHDLESWYWE